MARRLPQQRTTYAHTFTPFLQRCQQELSNTLESTKRAKPERVRVAQEIGGMELYKGALDGLMAFTLTELEYAEAGVEEVVEKRSKEVRSSMEPTRRDAGKSELWSRLVGHLMWPLLVCVSIEAFSFPLSRKQVCSGIVAQRCFALCAVGRCYGTTSASSPSSSSFARCQSFPVSAPACNHMCMATTSAPPPSPSSSLAFAISHVDTTSSCFATCVLLLSL
ncbi:hypothetical protein LMJF_31_1980 [Leishmania major strain Friedlin]|uniref:Uncharacterized protein n=1 Tax=Leishmania major TaxID=5664 RepID=Q4Q664_LEIMA|nr:hypothetical protein LMJF_31_1980 [Leishmania major strain Friedlin]CAG9579373.1 hypothetical_protein_-_conserved [Leishmania major strain Friedlin]CAJ08386.1 hypothetical protein LMJF_31_1980 [Leishmania major strain Friedlin]|eukprot:XP_001685184.1 hypothetical protein LMJF_31_1980 [Leishmania major strain Friedlin]